MSGKFKFVLIFTYCILAQDSFGLSPVILIPGDGGSQLEAKLNKSSVVHYICAKTSTDYFNIWLNLELLVPFVIDCFVDNTRLEYDNVTRTTRNPAGVDIRVPGWGNAEPVEWLDPSHESPGAYFNTIADALVKVGYVRNVSIRGAPYDFRKAPNENVDFFPKLKSLVEESYNRNNKSAVTLVVHSMGGSMALHFLRLQTQAWKDQYIRRMVSLSTPWGGSVKALKVFAIGDDLGSLMLRESVMRAQQITCPSLAWLLPSPLLWKPAEVLVQTDKFNYTIQHLQKLFTDMELPNAWEMRKDTERFSGDFSAPGVDVHCLYGYNISTVEKLVYKPGTWLDGYPTLAMGDGDGTVNLRSLSACQFWRPRRAGAWGARVGARGAPAGARGARGRTVKALALPGAEHLKILHDPRAIEYITTVMTMDD
ncbi:group XV phospholipase A2-like [Ostrinia furnacalis]|uniref:group XV phospholipase A2-like n=1 Tax=Ostrinia furnacalis TaxID=93504 RepID=UPI00103EC33A|nr:group XV phospholipase A2-like [Ostrinia furnacalis]XP_028168992.1 group XV phospholipase A2-like [Ostrinia furnacalis]XP_028168993.1 group XV phospholipase A2-like [Ostrinia furnacalis]